MREHLRGRLLRCLLRKELQAVVRRGCRWRRGSRGNGGWDQGRPARDGWRDWRGSSGGQQRRRAGGGGGDRRCRRLGGGGRCRGLWNWRQLCAERVESSDEL